MSEHEVSSVKVSSAAEFIKVKYFFDKKSLWVGAKFRRKVSSTRIICEWHEVNLVQVKFVRRKFFDDGEIYWVKYYLWIGSLSVARSEFCRIESLCGEKFWRVGTETVSTFKTLISRQKFCRETSLTNKFFPAETFRSWSFCKFDTKRFAMNYNLFE